MVEEAGTSSTALSLHYMPKSDFEQFLKAVSYQLKFYLRTWRFIGLLLFTVALTGGILAYQLHLGVATIQANNPAVTDFLGSALGNMNMEVIILAAFFGGDAISMDLGTATGYYMLTLPVRRPVLMMGRFTSAFLVSTGVAAVYFAVEAAGGWYIYGTLPGADLAVSVGLALFFLLACLALAFFLSSLFRSPSVSIVIILLLMLIGFPAVTEIVGDLGGYEPWWSLTYAGSVISTVFTNPAHEVTNLLGRGAHKIMVYTWSPYIWEGVVIMAAYLVVFFVLSIMIYNYRELKG
jgi:ABC-2 type transport system permease protein